MKPKHRSKLRLIAGKAYYTFKRYLFWTFGGLHFAKQQLQVSFPYPYFSHSTPLLRHLKDVDMVLQYNKITNLKLAVQKLDHVVLYPGETLSYWKQIGRPTKRKGYLEGMVLFCGTFGPGIGGGLCQLSNLIYWMSLHTPLSVTERYRHSFDVFPDSKRTQPFGSGATCYYNFRDLMIRNNTGQPFELCLEVTGTELTGCWKSDRPPLYRYRVYEKNHHIDREYWGGFSRHNTLYRQITDQSGEIVGDEYITENHALMMYNPYLEAGNVHSH